VVLGLPGLGLKTGAGDDLYNAEIQSIVCKMTALTIHMSAGGADLYSRNNFWRMAMRLMKTWLTSNDSNSVWQPAQPMRSTQLLFNQSVMCAIRQCTHAAAMHAALH